LESSDWMGIAPRISLNIGAVSLFGYVWWL